MAVLLSSAALTPTALDRRQRSPISYRYSPHPESSASAISRAAPDRSSSSPISSARRFSGYSASTPSFPSPLNPSAEPSRVSGRICEVRCEALGEGSQMIYQGVYGPWSVEPSDVREVILYRCGLVTAAASFVIASSAAFLPEGIFLGDIIKQDIDFLYAVGAGGLGLSLFLIHIYVTPIKRFLQALWAIGIFGSVGTYISLAQPMNESLIQYVIDNPVALWFVGPLFAALTGLVFKEGLCYGKLEAGILTFIIPGLLLGHLTGLMDDGVKVSLLGLWMALFVLFAARKFQQPIKDDIGDKSVFMFNALPEEEKKSVLQKLEQRSDQKFD